MARQAYVLSTRGSSGLVSLATTALNALAAGAVVEIDVVNTTEDDMLVDLELAVTFGTAPTADQTIDFYFRRSLDGTNFEDSSASRPPANGGVGSMPVAAVTSAQRLILPGVTLPPLTSKLVLKNSTSQAFSASGHVLRGLFYNVGIIA
jgi:hypothetical protein